MCLWCFFLPLFHTGEERWKHPSLGCHVNDTIASDIQIAFDSELPRYRCIGWSPSRHRFQCQTTEQSFGKHWQHPVFSFSAHFLTSSWALSESFRSQLTASTFRIRWMAPRNTNLIVWALLTCLDSTEMLLSVGFENYSKSSMRASCLGVKARLFLTGFQNGSLERWPLSVLTLWR